MGMRTVGMRTKPSAFLFSWNHVLLSPTQGLYIVVPSADVKMPSAYAGNGGVRRGSVRKEILV